MTHTPPIPQANQSPYPIQEPPHPHVAATPPVVASGDDAKSSETSLGDRLGALPFIAIGAAVGVGAALIGGVMFGLHRAKPKRRGRRKAR